MSPHSDSMLLPLVFVQVDLTGEHFVAAFKLGHVIVLDVAVDIDDLTVDIPALFTYETFPIA